MKKILTLALLATSLAVSAQAVIIGANAGYLVDSKTGYYTARIGHEFKSANGLAQLGEFEAGIAHDSDGPASVDLIPLMLNYRAAFAASGKLGTYFGAGAGFTRVKADVYWLHETDWSFSAQGFAGLTYQATEKTALNLGARYLWISDVRMFGTDVEIGDDVSLELGVSFKF